MAGLSSGYKYRVGLVQSVHASTACEFAVQHSLRNPMKINGNLDCCSADRVDSVAFLAIGTNIFITLGICIILVGALRRTDDMCKLSFELQRGRVVRVVVSAG